MQLEPGQLSTLKEMGIPVWEFRTTASNSKTVELSEQQLLADWLIVHDKENHTQQKQHLLTAMMLAIGVDINAVAVVQPNQLPNLASQVIANKIVLVFGKQHLSALAPELSNYNESQTEVYKLNSPGLNMIVTHDLSELMQQSNKKCETWQSLKLAQHTYKQNN